jgi:hypothetical protein
MSEHEITPKMLAAANSAHSEWIDSGRYASLRELYTAIFCAMESARLEGEEAARQERMKARQL